MDIRDAAEQVLTKARTALTTKEITKMIVGAGLWQTSGKTPEATVGASLYRDIKKNGDKSRFVRVAPNAFALRNSNGCSAPKEPAQADKAISSKPAGLSFIEVALRVLEEHGGHDPLHYRNITERALDSGWLVSSGKTPAATMYAQIITDIRRRRMHGERPRFVQHGNGYIGLNRQTTDDLTYRIVQHNQQVRKALLNRLLEMTPAAFEELVSQLLAEMGFEMVEVTKLNGDGGIDVRGTLVVGDAVRISMAVQAKRWNPKHRVQSPVVQQVRGSLGAHEQGPIITTSNFSSGAVKEAAQPHKTPIALMNGEQLVSLLMEHGIGVTRSTPDLFEIDGGFAGECVQNGALSSD
jgi:restriction system protein